MKCPSCENPLTPQRIAGMAVLVCEGGCGGFWFAQGEIRKLADRPKGAGRSLLNIPRAEGVRLFRDVDHICPRCTHTMLYRHCFSRIHEFEIDQCSRCGGFWVDTGSLSKLTANLGNEDPPPDSLKEYLRVLFEDKIAPMNQVNHDTLEAAQNIVRIYFFLCPASWFPDNPPVHF